MTIKLETLSAHDKVNVVALAVLTTAYSTPVAVVPLAFDIASINTYPNIGGTETKVTHSIDHRFLEQHSRDTAALRDAFADCERRIKSFEKLAKGWDSYGSDSPNRTAIANALAALELLYKSGRYPQRINPSSDEGVLFELSGDAETTIFEFFNTGDIAMLQQQHGAASVVLDIPRRDLEKTIRDLANG